MNAVVLIETPKDAARRLAAGVIRDGYKPTALYEYRAADGSPWCWRIRCDHPEGEKWMRPMHFDGTSYVLSEPRAPDHGKPLYRLSELAADPSSAVCIVEGEKCADALAKLGIASTTSGGASSADAADWTPLRGRECVIWPDNDDPGAKYARDVAARLRTLGCDPAVLEVSALTLPKHGDCADWIARNPQATIADVRALPFVSSVSEVEGGAENPIPLPSPLPEVPAFDPALLPDAVREWCTDTADGLQVPLDFTAIPAMIALAGAIGRGIGIKMKRSAAWVEPPILWGCDIGRPSSGKSPAMHPPRRMLDRLAGEERKSYEQKLREHESSILVAEASKANAKKAIQAALKAGNSDAATAEANALLLENEAPTEPRIVANDATVEKLGELLNANPRGLVLFRDELAGWLASLDREGREGDRAFYLECWNGTGPYTVDRIGRGTRRIEACAVSILGGMQPGKLAEYVRGAVRGGFSDDGLIQRFQLAVYPDVPNSWTYTDRAPSPNAEMQAWETFKRLRALDPAEIGAEQADWCDVPFLRFNDEAQELLIEWMTDHMQRLRAGDEPPWLESHFAKYPALVGRLALVLHLADGYRGPVSADILARALNWIEYLAGHARRIYAPAIDGGLSGAHLILKRRAEIGMVFTARDIYRRCWSGLSDSESVNAAIDVLVEYGHLGTLESTATAGRPSVTYTWKVP